MTTLQPMPRAASSSTARFARSLSAHTRIALPLAFAVFFAGAPASFFASSRLGATSTKLSSMSAGISATGTSFSLANFIVTQPCLPMP